MYTTQKTRMHIELWDFVIEHIFFQFWFLCLILCITLVRFKAECMKSQNRWLSSYYHWKESRKNIGKWTGRSKAKEVLLRTTEGAYWCPLLPFFFWDSKPKNRNTSNSEPVSWPNRAWDIFSAPPEGSSDLVDFVRQHHRLYKARSLQATVWPFLPPEACHPYVEKHCSKYIYII